MFRGSFRAFTLGLVMLGGCLVAFGLDAPTVVGALFIVAMLACGVIGLVLAAGEANRVKAAAHAAHQQRAREKAPWED